MKKLILLSITILFLISIVNAITITTFNNSLTGENLTLEANQNTTRFISIHNQLNITSAYLNLSGLLIPRPDEWINISNQDTAYIKINAFSGNDSQYCIVDWATNPDTARCFYNDGTNFLNFVLHTISTNSYEAITFNESAYFALDNGQPVEVYSTAGVYRYTFTTDLEWGGSLNWLNLGSESGLYKTEWDGIRVMYANQSYRYVTTNACFAANAEEAHIVQVGDYIVIATRANVGDGYKGICVYDKNWIKQSETSYIEPLKLYGNESYPGSTFEGFRYYNNSFWTISDYNRNDAVVAKLFRFNLFNITDRVNITVNGSNQIFNYPSNFINRNNKTTNFYSLLNNYKNSCTLNNAYCSIPILFNSKSFGTLEYSNLVITAEEYTRPNLTIYSPNGTYTGITNIPINFTAADNYQLDKCWYNVTRGASLEVDNTYINCSTTNTFTVTSSASYVFRMCINDTSNNLNCSFTNFTTVAYVPPVQGGGGGGAGTTTTATNWYMRTDSGTKAFSLKMSSNDVRDKQIYFSNEGVTVVSVTMSCQGNACPLIAIENNTAIIPPSKIDGARIRMRVITSNTTFGNYTANIIATDTTGAQNYITLNVDVSSSGYIFSLANRLTENANILDIKIPYIIIALVVSFIIYQIANRLLKKTTDIAPAIALILATIGALLALIII